MRENTRVWPGDASAGEIEVLSEELVWSHPMVRLYYDQVRFPARRRGRHVEGRYFRLAHGEGKDDGVCVAPIAADDRVLLVRTFRHPARMWLRELPRGARERDESPAAAAARELREELGCRTRVLYPLGRVCTDSGQLSSVPHLFAARVVRAGRPRREPGEAIDRAIAYRFTDLLRACRRGEIIDALTLAAVTRLQPHFDGDRFEYKVGPG
ncbi:MAG TPA: NUDIX hydrolase [Gemmatimonadaceae bacterium]|nr:NUDIX hydrolase [Gemmatimonadaceae bacterium]